MSIDRTFEPRPDREAREVREYNAEQRELRADKGPDDGRDYHANDVRELAIMRLVASLQPSFGHEGMSEVSRSLRHFHEVNSLWLPEWERLRKREAGQ